jgi:anti-anti-sigma factor
MTITESTHAGVVVLAPVGRIDTTTSPQLDDTVRRVVDGGARNLVVDFAGCDYISSAGLRVLLVLAKRVKSAGGRLVLCGMPPPVRQVFDLAGFSPLFTIAPSRDAALTEF